MADMTAEAIGESLPAVITLDFLARMMAADQHGHRYELSPEGVLSVVPPPESGHAKVASRLMFWLGRGGWPDEQVMQAVGIKIAGPEGDGGRIPDVALWARPQPDGVWLSTDDLLLVVEIVSRGSQTIDQVTKVDEYAAAGIPQYWTVARDPAQTVTLHKLSAGGRYEVAAKVPLTWLLQTTPADHGLGP
jgi:Uma2 family endonuclease